MGAYVGGKQKLPNFNYQIINIFPLYLGVA